MGRSKVKSDFREWDALKARLNIAAPAMNVKVGVNGADAMMIHPLEDDITVEEVAMINEFGTEHVPERSFLRATFYRKQAANKQLLYQFAKVSRDVLFKNATREQGLEDVGKWGVEQVRATIMSNVEPENAEETVRKKGHGLTLRHTMTLYNAISYVVNKGRGTSLSSGLSGTESFGEEY